MEYILNDLDSLHKLRNERALKNSIRKIKVQMENANQSGVFEKKLNKHYFACGCAVGQIAVTCTLFAFGMVALIDGTSDLLVWWKIVSCLVASALLGKMIGLVISYQILQKTYSELESLLT